MKKGHGYRRIAAWILGLSLIHICELPRAQAHGGEHWHQVVHVWLYGTFRRERCVFLQKRAAEKKTYPGF